MIFPANLRPVKTTQVERIVPGTMEEKLLLMMEVMCHLRMRVRQMMPEGDA
jgi:hypothetical protein